MTEVAPSVHRLEYAIGDKLMAMHLIDGDRVTLIDTGLPDTPETVYLPALQALGRSPDDVGLVVITHADADHIGGNNAVRRRFPHALIACHPLDKRWATDPDVITAERYDGFLPFGLRYDPEVFALLRSWMGETEPIDLLLTEGSRLRVRDDEWLEIDHVPGHTPGHILLHNPTHRYALIGDAIFGVSQITTGGAKSAAPAYTDVAAYRATIAKIRALDLELMLTCHYPVMRGAEIERFIDESLAWSERAENAVRRLLTSATQPITLGDAIDRLDPELGPFMAPRELQWALLAHLDYAVDIGEAQRTTLDEIIAWELPD